MKKENYNLSVEKPCHEDWNAMKPNEKGRFCSQCSKTVVDFSYKNDAEIISTILSDKNLCGRFTNLQLEKPLVISKPDAPVPWWQAVMVAGISLVSFNSCKNKDNVTGKVAVVRQDSLLRNSKTGEIQNAEADTNIHAQAINKSIKNSGLQKVVQNTQLKEGSSKIYHTAGVPKIENHNDWPSKNLKTRDSVSSIKTQKDALKISDSSTNPQKSRSEYHEPPVKRLFHKVFGYPEANPKKDN